MKRSLFLVPLLLLAGAASAAPDPFDAFAADIRILQAKVVQTDLGITAAQRTKLNAAADAHKKRLMEYDKQLRALGSVSPDRAKLQGFFVTLKKDVLAVLTPPQLRRLRELSLQRAGLGALVAPQVASKIGLSPAQVTRLKAALDAGKTKYMAAQRAAAGPILAPYQGKKPKDQAQAQAWQKEVQDKLKTASIRVKPQLMAIDKATTASMTAVLTGPQKAKWEALKGRPFKAK